MPKNFMILLFAILASGCSSESPDARLTRVTEQALAEQAAQNQRMAELEQNVQSRSATLDQQRDGLEQQRRDLARARIREPLVANALLSTVTLLIAALPLLASLLLLFHVLRQAPAADLSEVLIDELATDRLRLAVGGQRPAQPAPTPPALPAPESPTTEDHEHAQL